MANDVARRPVAQGKFCSRCSRQLVLNHGEVECLSCGPVTVPVVTPAEARAEVEAPPEARSRGRGAITSTVPWTEEERLTWETWKEGDAVPVYEAESQERRAERQPAQVLEPEMQVLDTAKLALLMVKSLRGLAAELRRAQERDAAVRAEARKLMGIAALCGGVIPDDVLAMFGSKPKRAAVVVSAGNSEAAADMLVCPDCGREFGTSGGFGIHRARIHEGKSWDSSANFKPKAVEAVNGGE